MHYRTLAAAALLVPLLAHATDPREGLALDTARGRVYSTRIWDDTVLVLDAASAEPEGAIRVGRLDYGSFPKGALLDSKHARLFVSNGRDASVSVVDVATQRVTANIGVEQEPRALAIDPGATRVFVGTDHGVMAIDAERPESARVIGPRRGVLRLAADAARVYVAFDTGGLGVIDAKTGALAKEIETTHLAALLLDPKARRLYAAEHGTMRIRVVDLETLESARTIELEATPRALALSTDGATLYAANDDDGTLARIDLATGAVQARIEVGGAPRAIELDASRQLLVVARARAERDPNAEAAALLDDAVPEDEERPAVGDDAAIVFVGLDPFAVLGEAALAFAPEGLALDPARGKGFVRAEENGSLATIDLARRAVADAIEGRRPTAIALAPGGARLFVTDWDTNTLTVLDPAGHDAPAHHLIGRQPDDVVLARDGARAFVVVTATSKVHVVEATTGGVLARWNAPAHPIGAALASSGALLVASDRDKGVAVIDTTNGATVALIPAGEQPVDVAAAAEASRAVAVDTRGNALVLLDVEKRVAAGTIALPDAPRRAALDAAGKRAYVCTGADTLLIIDLESRKVLARTKTGNGPYAIALDEKRGRVWVANTMDNHASVSVFDAADGHALGKVKTGWRPNAIAIDADAGRAYVLDSHEDKVTVIDAETLEPIARIAE